MFRLNRLTDYAVVVMMQMTHKPQEVHTAAQIAADGPQTPERVQISRLTAETLPWYLRLYGVMIGASIPAIARRAAKARWSSKG